MEFSSRLEYALWRKKQMALPIEELIKEPNCKLLCPQGREFCCGCDKCTSYPIVQALKDKFSKLWDEKTGFYRERQGCVLERKDRPEACLRMICNWFEKTAG